jgi:hypothetical protein
VIETMVDARGSNGSAAAVAGSLILLALVGHVFVDALWLALVPAAAFMVLAAGDLHALQGGRDGVLGVVGTLALEGGAGLLLLSALAGAVAKAALGMEPAWMTTVDIWSAWVFLIGVILFGTAAAIANVLPRGSVLAFVACIPLGFALDTVAERMASSAGVTWIAPGELLAGVGLYLGLGIFALALLRIGLRAKRLEPPAPTGDSAAGSSHPVIGTGRNP